MFIKIVDNNGNVKWINESRIVSLFKETSIIAGKEKTVHTMVWDDIGIRVYNQISSQLFDALTSKAIFDVKENKK